METSSKGSQLCCCSFFQRFGSDPSDLFAMALSFVAPSGAVAPSAGHALRGAPTAAAAAPATDGASHSLALGALCGLGAYAAGRAAPKTGTMVIT